MVQEGLSDHVNMTSQRDGKVKAVPCWQIRDWIEKTFFSLEVQKGNRVGWDFTNPAAGRADYEKWLTVQLQREAEIRRRRANGGALPMPADPGLAGAADEARRGAALNANWSPQPPEPLPPLGAGQEGESKRTPSDSGRVRPMPKDMI